MGYGGTPDYVQTLRDVVVVLMIEKKGVTDRLEEVLCLDGVDMVQWGGRDYCMSIGRPGDWLAPDVKAIERHVIKTSLQVGIQPRAEINSPDQAGYYLDLGVRHFCLGTDVSILFQWLKQNGEGLRRVIDGA
jgi:4-hydroxy-2-oxoheptanedioate aldolase